MIVIAFNIEGRIQLVVQSAVSAVLADALQIVWKDCSTAAPDFVSDACHVFVLLVPLLSNGTGSVVPPAHAATPVFLGELPALLKRMFLCLSGLSGRFAGLRQLRTATYSEPVHLLVALDLCF
jgi:hypothetical protein